MKMDVKAAIWSVLLCAGLLAWLYLDISSMHINYEWHNYLVDDKTGQKIKPMELLDLNKIINITDSYLNRTNAIERLFDLEYNSVLENPITLDQIYSSKRELELSAWPIANQNKCGEHLDWINGKLKEHKSYQLLPGKLGYELTQLVDSFGKPESGLYSGTINWVGSYKQCHKLALNGGQIKTRYCQARLRPKWWPKSRPATNLKMGICLPESCDTLSFGEHSAKISELLRVDLPEFYKANLEFDSMFCLPDERSPLRRVPTSGRIYMAVIGAWLAVVILASIQYELVRWRARRRFKSYELATDSAHAVVDFHRQHQANLSQVKLKPLRLEADKHQDAELQHDSKQDANATGQLGCASALVRPSRETSPKLRLLEALSIHNSLKEFKSNSFRTHPHDKFRARVDLGCLDFFKVLFAVLVVLAHSGYLTSVYSRSMSNRIDMSLSDSSKLVMSIGRCVDSFFMFFGLLTAYTLLRKFSAGQLSNPFIWIYVNFGILLRIAPVFMLVYWYSRSVSPYTGSGPWWDYGVHKYSLKGYCMNEPWWKSIPYFGCVGSPPVAPCLLPGWFIVSYSQLSLLMPLLTYLMCKLPSTIWRYLLLLFVMSISGLQLAFKMYKQTSFRDEAFTLYGAFLVDLMEKFESTGMLATLGRVGCVSIGCYAGYLLRMYEIGQIEHWPRWFSSRITALVALLLHSTIVLLPVIGNWWAQSSGHIATLNEFLSSFLVTMVVWPTLNAFVLLNATTVSNRTALVRFASHTYWHIFNKLGLCIFLVHWEVIFFGVTSHEQAPSMGFMTDIGKMWTFGLLFSILFAFAIHILFEAPLSALVRLVLGQVQQRLSKSVEQPEPDCYSKPAESVAAAT